MSVGISVIEFIEVGKLAYDLVEACSVKCKGRSLLYLLLF